MFRSALCYLRHTLRSLSRNRWMGFTSVMTAAIALFILGIFVMGMLNIQKTVQNVEQNLEIIVWMEAQAERSEVKDIQAYIANIIGVTHVELVTKEEGLTSLSSYFGHGEDLRKALEGDNPLPDYLVVKTISPEYVKKISAEINMLPSVEKVDYGQNYLDKLLALLHWVRILGGGIVFLLLLAVVLIIANTIRLTIYARRKEIKIMKYVGATNWFVRWPFLLEGMILGFLGSLIAGGALYFGYLILIGNISQYITFIPLVDDTTILAYVSLGIVGAGSLLGGLASLLSLGRYLRL